MIKNYFKIAWRGLAKNKLYTIVNIGGLTAGITCCLLIGLYLSNELSFDRFHKNANCLFRVTDEYTVNGAVGRDGTVGSMAGPRLSGVFPQIKSFVRIQSFAPYVVRYGEKTFVEKRFFWADPTFFEMFSFPLLEGDPHTALDAPRKIVLSMSMERKYFGEEKALGKVLRIGGTDDYMVSGVAEDAPANSQLQYNFVASFSSLSNANRPNWWVSIYATYFLLRNPGEAPALEKQIATYMNAQKDRGQGPGDHLIYHLEPMTKVHLYSNLNGLEPNGNITYVYILGAIALLILCIACVNYTNLATAQSATRIPEIGIRKVLGSARWQLFWQFIGESLLLNFVAFILAIAATVLLVPAFDRLVEQPLGAEFLLSPPAVGGMIGLFLLISFASGAYPAFIMSSLRLIKVLKAGFSFSGGTGMLRRSLIVFQFMVSVFLIISTVVIFQQLSYIQHKNLGYDKDHVLVLPVDQVIRENFKPLKDALARVPNVESVTCGAEEVTNILWGDELRTANSLSAPPLIITASPADIDFVKTLGLTIIAGGDYTQADWMALDSSRDNRDPHTSYMLNESMLRALKWTPDQAIGRTVYRSGHKGIVKAVVRDFHFQSLKQPIGPLLIFLDSGYQHIFQTFVKVSGKDLPATLQALETTWRERVPHRPFQYHFLDDNYNALYHSERQTASIFSTFSTLAILLACLGLFALAAYSTVQRAREIGIRKVLGADVWQIATLISGDFIKLVVIAAIIAFPIAWFSMQSWLQNFAYRIDIGWWVFVVAGLVATMIALMSIGFQVLRAANANPAKILKTE
jgi:putative ABC transport system permease protein